MKNKIRFLAMMLIGVLLSVNQVWGATIAYWENQPLTANTGVAATSGNGTMTSNINLQTPAVYTHRNDNIGTSLNPTIILSNLSLSGEGLSVSYIARSSQQKNVTISTSTNGSSYTQIAELATTKAEVLYTVSNIPVGTKYIKFVYNNGSSGGSFYFGTVKITNNAGTYQFNKLTATNTAGWTGSDWDGTYLIVNGSNALSGYVPAEKNFYAVADNDGVITINDIDQAFNITYVAGNGYTVKGVGCDKYLTSANNSVGISDNPYYNTAITYESLVGPYNSSSATLYWNQSKFGYYTSGTYTKLSLYKQSSSVTYTDYLTDCAAQEYNVTYHMNGGGWKGCVGAATYTYGVGIPALATCVDRTGYGFAGWYDNADLTGDPVTSISTTATGDKEFWAKWNVGWKFMYNGDNYTEHTVNSDLTYTVHLDGNTTYWFRFSDGALVYRLPGDGTMTCNSCTNWDFWKNNNKDCGIATTAPGDYTFRIDDSDAANKLIVSVTYPASVAVTMNLNGQDSNYMLYTVPGGTISAPANPSADGYAFLGWFTDQACSPGHKWDFSNTISEDMTLYAKWTESWYYTGEWDDNWEHKLMTMAQDGIYWYWHTYKSDKVREFKIVHNDWYHGRNCNQPGFNCTNITNMNSSSSTWDTEDENCAVYENSNDRYYIIVYPPQTDANPTDEPIICASTTLPDATKGFTIPSGVTVYFDNYSRQWSNLHLRMGRSCHNLAWAMTKVPGTANLWKFTTDGSHNYSNYWAIHVANNNGWTNGNSIYKTNTGDNNAITNATSFMESSVGSDITIIPGNDHSTGTSGDNNNNCEFYSYTKQSGMLTHNAAITAPTNGTITVTYTDVNNSGQNFTSGNRDLAHSCILTISAACSTGYDLATLTVNGTPFTSGSTLDLTEDITIAATFSLKQVTITLDNQDATTAGQASVTATYTQAMPSIAGNLPEKTGYDFGGYFTSQNGAGTKYYNADGTSAKNSDFLTATTLFAYWTNKSYSVTLNTNGGTINSGNVTGYTYGTGATLPTDVTKTDYKFRGWYDNSGFTGTAVTAIGATETGNKEFWAKWEETSYSNYRTRCDNYWYVTYNANGKVINEPLPTDDYGYGDDHTTSVNLSTATLTTTGYRHIGWNTDPAATTVLESPHTITGNTTFYAIWTPSVYTISYKDQGGGDYSGSNLSSLPASHTYNTATDLVAGVKAGHRFEGWYKNSGCTDGPVTTLGATEYTADITLYAKWTAVYAITYTIPSGGGTLATDAQTSAASGETVTMPGLQGGNQVPEPYDCETLIGWTTRSTAYESKAGVMPDPFYAVGTTSPTITGATTFYAVYSRQGAGPSGTIGLTDMSVFWDDECAKSNSGSQIGYGDCTERTAVVDDRTWGTISLQQKGDKSYIQFSNSNTSYLKIPNLGGNISEIRCSVTNASGNAATKTIVFKSSLDGDAIATSESESSYSRTLTISEGDYQEGYIVAGDGSIRIISVAIDYGAPAIISTGLNCNNDILEFTVTYNANSGQFPGATTTCTSDEHHFNGDDPETNPYTICSDATCAGMTLVGWNSQMDGQGGLSYTPGQVISSVSQEEITLYAQFAYNVTVKDNDDVQVNVHPSERGGAIDLDGGNDVCVSAKYEFIGWTVDNPATWKQTITSPTIFSSDKVTTYTPTAVGTQVTAVYGMSTSVGSQAFYIGYDAAGTPTYLTMSPRMWQKTTDINTATSIYKETITAAENKYHLYYMANGVKTYIYYSGSGLSTTTTVDANHGWVITTSGAVTTIQSIQYPGKYFSYSDSQFTDHANPNPLAIYTGAKEYKYYDETTCTDEITITFNAGGGTMDPVTTQIVGHEGDVITVPTCSYPGWTWIGWVNTSAEAQSDIKIDDAQIYTNEDGHEYEIPDHNETLYAYYTKTPEPPVFDGNISDVWKIYVPTVDGSSGNNVYHYEVGAKEITNASAHGEYATTTRCIDATDWAFTNVGTNQFTIQNPKGLYLNGDPNGDENDIYFSTNPSVWTMENKGNGFYKFVNQNTPNRYLAFRLNNGDPTFINTSTANETNPSYSYIKVGGCTNPVYTTSPGGEFKLNMLGNVRVTSTNNKTVRSVDALSISADNLTPNTAITLSADPAVLTFCDATGAALNLTTNANGNLANTAVYVKYTPTAYNTIETPTITATCGEQHQGFAGLVTGRSLPEKFIIAQKVGADWYALPNNMTNRQTNPAAVKISAVNEGTGTATIYSDVVDHLAYQLQSKGTGTGMAFSSPVQSDNIIKANTTAESSTIGLYAQSGWSGNDVKFYEFTPVTSDLVDYTLQNVFQTNYLGITEGNWGVYSDAATVRFLAIDQQPAATITWQNEMLGTQHAQNAAEDGVITLPTGDAPAACERAIAAGWVFFGWGDQITNTKTAAPTILVGGEVAKADKTYYAIFRRGTENVWRTSCPTVYTITYQANGGEGADYVQYTELTTATAVDITTAGFTKEGSQFIGWTVGDSETLIQQGGTISGINSDITVNAQWMGELVISGDVRLTSAVSQKVATAPAGITFSSTDMSYATALRITYRDETNGVDYDRSTYAQSEFRLCNGSYAVADNSNISLAEVTGAYNQTYSIAYTPNGNANTLDHYTMKVEVLHSQTVIATVTKDLYGRTLPEKFAIVAHVGDMWYALPNNMGNEGTYAPVAVSVDNSDASIVNWTATGAKTAGYSMKAMTADYNKLRFAAIAEDASNQNCLWASTKGNTGIRNRSATSTDSTYRWTVTPQDVNFQAYTLVNEKNTQNLRYWSAQNAWGMYASGETNLYFIPLTDMEVADFQVIEWFANKVLIETNNQVINTSAAKTSVGSGEFAEAIVDGTTYGTNQYTLTTGDLTTSAGQPLNIQYQTTAGDAWYINSVKVPIILSRGTYATSGEALGGLDKSKYKDNDLVVRDGATLTVDAGTGTHNTFKNVTIYPNSKVVVPEKANGDDTKEVTMTTTTMTLFGGIDEIYDGSGYTMTTYAVPQLVLKGKLKHEATVQGLRYDIRVDDAIYYDFALPYESMYELVSDHKGAYDYKYWVKNYNGAARATGATGWTWYDWNADPWKINIGTGYLLAAQSKVNQNYVIMRHPMGYYDTGEDRYAKNPNGHQTNTPEATKAAITVKAYPSSFDSNVGWNFIANPFMANFQLDQDGEETGTIQTGELVEHKVNGKWDGHYDWADNENKNVRYVTTYSYETGEYTQHKMSETALPPFTGFFVQIAKDGQIVFDINGRANAAPARMLSDDELPSEMEITLKVNGQNESDETVMLLTKDLSRSNAREFPDEQTKMVNDGILNYYTYGGEDTKMYANGMNYEEGQEWNKAGIMVKTAGEYTFSVNGVNENYVEQVILKDMDSNTEYDLISNDATIYMDKGEMNDRFYVKIVFGKHNIGTGITERYDTSAPEKFILNDHMYIRANGVLFDGVGKRVKY